MLLLSCRLWSASRPNMAPSPRSPCSSDVSDNHQHEDPASGLLFTRAIDGLTRSLLIALSTFPAALYLLIEKVILQGNTPVLGSRLVRTWEYLNHAKAFQCLGILAAGIRSYSNIQIESIPQVSLSGASLSQNSYHLASDHARSPPGRRRCSPALSYQFSCPT